MSINDNLETIKKLYSNSITIPDSVNRTLDFFEKNFNIEPTQVIFADCICSDEVNSMQYPENVRDILGPFKIGGLAGFPFTGSTGVRAFSSHVPNDGVVVIYYGPHIGISKEGSLGEIHRIGQSKNTACCGAIKGALHKLLNGQIIEGDTTEMDYQMNTIEQILLQQKGRIEKAEIPLKEATEIIYEAIDKRMNDLVETTPFQCKFIILIGAILINSDYDMVSYTSTKRYDMIDLDNNKRQSFIEQFLLS